MPTTPISYCLKSFLELSISPVLPQEHFRALTPLQLQPTPALATCKSSNIKVNRDICYSLLIIKEVLHSCSS